MEANIWWFGSVLRVVAQGREPDPYGRLWTFPERSKIRNGIGRMHNGNPSREGLPDLDVERAGVRH